MGTCTHHTAGVRVHASRDRHAEITSGRAMPQQGLAAIGTDPPDRGTTIGWGRDVVWRMSP